MSFITRPLGVFLTVLSVLATPALAQSRTDAVRQALAQVPAVPFAPGEGVSVEIEFGDIGAAVPQAAVQALRGNLSFDPMTTAAGRTLPSDLRNGLLAFDFDLAAERSGFNPLELRSILTIRREARALTVATLAPGMADRMIPALAASGHDRQDRGAVTVLSRGADYAVDPEARDRGNPFAGMMGRSTRIALEGDLLRVSPGWPEMEAALDPGAPRLLSDPRIGALLAGLEQGAGAEGALAAARVFFEADGTVSLVADLPNGVENTALMIRLVDGPDGAEALAATIRANWATVQSGVVARTYAELVPGDMAVSVVAGTPAALVLRVTAAHDLQDPMFQNRSAERFLQMVLIDDLGPLMGQ